MPMLIGELAKKSGFTRDAIRHYEKIGLLRHADQRQAGNNYKIYCDDALLKLRYLAQLKEMGFSLKQSRVVLQLADNPKENWLDIKQKLLEKRGEIEDQIKQLEEHRGGIDAILKQYF